MDIQTTAPGGAGGGSTVYIACHNQNPGLTGDCFQAIHVGKAGGGAAIHDTIGDDTGDHISDRNDRYCEVTAIYWAWKNSAESNRIGLMHYRRFLDFAGESQSKSTEEHLRELDLRAYEQSAAEWIDANADSYDLVLPKRHRLGRTMEKNYASAHHRTDLDICREIIVAEHPEQVETFDRVMAGRELYLANMFLMRRDLFDEYCAWLFPILEKADADPRGPKYLTLYQSRRIGFLAERLFTIYMIHLTETRPSLRVRHVNILNTARALVSPVVDTRPLNAENQVNVAFSSDLAFLPHTAAMVNSLKQHADPANTYNLFYLYSDIPTAELDVFQGVVNDAPNIRLHCIDVGRRFEKAYRSNVRAPSNATYNRFLLFDLLAGLERLLYVDVDMIICGDVAEIYRYPVGDAQIAAVPDYIMTRGLCVKAKLQSGTIEDLRSYQRDVLGMNDEQIAGYFNAGLLLFNFAAMDDPRKTGRELMERAFAGEYFFRDQDILNSCFRDSYFQLPARYNVFNSLKDRYTNVPVENHREAMAAKRDPFIIHYASKEFKPWSNPDVHFGQHYWESLRQTPFHQSMMTALMRRQIAETEKPRQSFGTLFQAARRKIGL